MFRSSTDALGDVGGLPTSSLVTGTLVTGTNPAFYIWWVTVGIALVVGATKFGLAGILLFTLVHWCCDLAWSEFLSAGTFKSRRWWTQKVRKVVFTICALILIGFGVWFCSSAFL
jgi:threonine/homoserine/homoserine lactone efflux protein